MLSVFAINAQIIVIDAGHGYGSSTSVNPDTRTATEIETNLSVALKTRTLIQNSCSALTVKMTRTTNINGWISVSQRAQMSNSWNADRLLSIHCNAGGGTGTETFYCTHNDPTPSVDLAFSKKIQADMVAYGTWTNRRCVEDASYLPYHLGVLKYSSATACLSEIGFVDSSSDAPKLNNDTWRNKFAASYFNSLKVSLNVSCSSSTPAPGSFTLTATPQCVSNSSSIKLSWTASSNATKYDIYRNGSLYAADQTGTSFDNTYVTTGTSYTYYVKAKNATGSVNNSNGTLSRTATCAPGSFSVTATAICSGSTSAINVTWTASANATAYDIYRNGNLYATDVTGTEFLNTYLITAGTTYTFSMVAKSASGTIANSNGTRSAKAISCTGRRDANDFSLGNEVVIYPNPSSDFISIQISNVVANKMNVNIYDISGRLVKSVEFNPSQDSADQRIDISTFSSGTYFINGVIDNKEFVKKFIKN